MSNLILIDDREDRTQKGMAEALEGYSLAPTVTRLQFGDLAFFPNGLSCGIEIKTVSDLLSSMSSKRLVSQAHGLAENYDLAFIMVKGGYMEKGGHVAFIAPRHPKADAAGIVTSGWAWDSFMGIKTDLMLLGIDFYEVPRPGDVPREIARLVTNLSKEDHNWLKQRTRPEVLTADSQYRNAVWSLCAFDGLGPETVEAMLRKYDSVAALVMAAATVLQHEDVDKEIKLFCQGVEGLGPKRAKGFIEEVTQSWR